MRTNIDIDDALMAEAMKLLVQTKRQRAPFISVANEQRGQTDFQAFVK